MEAEWSENEAVWLPLSLITKCIDSQLELWNFEDIHRGKFFGGLDLGKHQDYSVFTVVEEVEDKYLLRHVKAFPLETKYATVIGYVKTLCDRWQYFSKIRIDVSGVGEYIVEDTQNLGITKLEPVTFTATKKQELANLLKQRMLEGAYLFPYADIHMSPTKKLNYVAELNIERFEIGKDGSLHFSHPQNQHDDVWWSTTLAISCNVKSTPEPFVAVIPNA